MRRCGHSLIETLIAVGLLLIIAGMGTPLLLSARDDARARSAADHLASLFHLARMEALKRHVNVALRFSGDGAQPGYALYADGNGNGVRTVDIESGADRSIRSIEHLGNQFPGVGIQLDQGVPDLDGEAWTRSDGVRVGASRMVSFSPVGTSTSGSIYVLGRRQRQFAVRVLGPMGRIRTFEYAQAAGRWRTR
jgi:type II secretory pathway pseudopilin PulG